MPKGVYERTPANRPKPRSYPDEIVALVRRLYLEDGLTVREVQAQLPPGYKAQRIVERHIAARRPAAKRDQFGPRNASWKGDEASYAAVHLRLGSAAEHVCPCGAPAAEWSYNGGCSSERVSPANVRFCHHQSCYVARCVPCHRDLDHGDLPRDASGRFLPRGGDAR